ncbi:MAG: hypothetical protein P857_125 [Candidatus Xenolissoclinum pacificiensis L6]|uniref:Uncharacterized protein n=1 Tax=Candidatus Xenolissoclinum pacificiensis L6 TaxID=1401685 RepID=W2UYU6_9RICK|nr:MAG: hypothetical protein P857_125 [Candidatus Xenolissoclinum pacificiensis L6]
MFMSEEARMGEARMMREEERLEQEGMRRRAQEGMRRRAQEAVAQELGERVIEQIVRMSERNKPTRGV